MRQGLVLWSGAGSLERGRPAGQRQACKGGPRKQAAQARGWGGRLRGLGTRKGRAHACGASHRVAAARGGAGAHVSREARRELGSHAPHVQNGHRSALTGRSTQRRRGRSVQTAGEKRVGDAFRGRRGPGGWADGSNRQESNRRPRGAERRAGRRRARRWNAAGRSSGRVGARPRRAECSRSDAERSSGGPGVHLGLDFLLVGLLGQAAAPHANAAVGHDAG